MDHGLTLVVTHDPWSALVQLILLMGLHCCRTVSSNSDVESDLCVSIITNQVHNTLDTNNSGSQPGVRYNKKVCIMVNGRKKLSIGGPRVKNG